MITSSSNSSGDRTDKNASHSTGNKDVTEETKRLQEMYERLNKRSQAGNTGNGHYFKLKDGEHKRLLFDSNKVTEEDVSYPSNPD